MAATSYVLVMSTYPSHTTAESAAIEFVEKRLVACTNISPLLTSIYEWQGSIQQSNEVLVIMKTQQEKLAELEKTLLTSHPYETPEFIVLSIGYASMNYLRWLDNAVK